MLIFSPSFKALKLLLLPLLLIGVSWVLPAQASHPKSKQLDSLIDKIFLTVGDSGPGVSVFVHQAGFEPYRRVQGQANLEYGIPLTEHSVFDLASVAKQFTGLAIAKLELAGEISLTDDVRKYLPEVPDFGKMITLEHLVHHTSGLRDVGELCRIGNFTGALTGARGLEIIALQKALNFAPATAHDYSNTGYVLLALVVERVTGQSFAEWCKENIFVPLKMNETLVNDAPDNLIINRAVAYYGREEEFSFDQNNGMSLIGSSAVFSSPADMEKWMAFLAGDAPSVRRMMEPGQLGDGTPVGYGFGLSIGTFEEQPFINHSGATPAGFRTLIAMLPALDVRLVILSNWGNLEPIQQLGLPILNLLLGASSASKAPAEETVKVFTEDIPEGVLNSYVGNYLFNGELPVSVSREGKDLFITVADRPTVSLAPRSMTEFYSAAMNSTLSFEAVDQKVVRVAIRMKGEQHGELRPVGNAEATMKYTLPEGASGHFYSEELDLLLTITQQDDGLWLFSGRHGTHQLLQRSDFGFVGVTNLFEELNLEAGAGGEVQALILNLGSRARNLRFTRWQPQANR